MNVVNMRYLFVTAGLAIALAAPAAVGQGAAVALSADGTGSGFAAYSTMDAAVAMALSSCRASTATGDSCRVVGSVPSGCVAAAWNASGYATGTGPDIASAVSSANSSVWYRTGWPAVNHVRACAAGRSGWW